MHSLKAEINTFTENAESNAAKSIKDQMAENEEDLKELEEQVGTCSEDLEDCHKPKKKDQDKAYY